MPLHLRVFLAILGLFFLISCSSSKNPENDTDILPDTDTDSQDVIVDDDTDEEDSDFVDDSDETPDQDGDADTIPDIDSDEDVACLDLRYNENTIKTPFPFKDANGKPTFCRPGCDMPTENDPQCVRNIWDWENWEEQQAYLKEQEKDPNQTKERSCYPWPCKLPDMHAKTKAELSTFVSSCDRLLTVNNFMVSMGTIWTHGMYDGVAGMHFQHSDMMVEYNPEKDEYTTVGMARRLSFNENRYIVEVYDSYPGENPNTFKSFTVSVLRTEKGYFYELIRNNHEFKDTFFGPPFAGKNWVLLRLTGNNIVVQENWTEVEV